MSDILRDFDKKNEMYSIKDFDKFSEKAFENISNIFDRISKDIQDQKDNAMAMEFTKCIGELLRKNGVVPKLTEYTRNFETDKTFEARYGVTIDALDFSEHDKVFADKIAELEKRIQELDTIDAMRIDEKRELKQRIVELESRETEKPTKINLNDRVKVKLTPLGAEIYYHQYDDIHKDYPKMKKHLQSSLPKVDENGYTEFQLWHFMELYGEHIGMCKKNVIEPLDIIIAE